MPPPFAKCVALIFNIGHGGENAISQHIISQWYIRATEVQKGSTKHTMLMLCTMFQCNVMQFVPQCLTAMQCFCST